MRQDCKIVPLTELVKGYIDNRGKTVPTSEEGIPLIATNCIKERGLFPIKEKLRYVSQEIYDSWFRAHPEPFDIIIVNKGTPGLVCFVPDPVDFCIAQDMVALKIDEEKVYKKYLFAFMRSEDFKHQVSSLAVGTTIPHLKKTDFKLLNIPLPEYSVQKYIGDLYFNIMHKIEVNININQILEEMAMSLYKERFVVKDDIERVGIEQFGDIIGGGTPKTSISEYWDGNIPWISVKDLDSSVIIDTEKKITDLGLKNSSTKLLPSFSTVISARGTIGNISIIGDEMTMNQSCYAIKAKEDLDCFVFLTLKRSIDTLINQSHGSVFNTITTSTLRSLQFPFEIKIAREFEEDVKHLFQQILSNIRENKELQNIKSYLFPHLLSGETDFKKKFELNNI
jgi:type I restriction enzyme, S subunit